MIRTLERVHRFAGSGLRSRLAWIVVALHGAWFLIAVANLAPPSPEFARRLDNGEIWMTALFAGRPSHFQYDPLAFQLLTLAGLPAMLASLPLALILWPVLSPFGTGHFVGSYVGAALFFIVASAQWLFIGRLVERILESKQLGATLLALGVVTLHSSWFSFWRSPLWWRR
jgi:hypothetical protein